MSDEVVVRLGWFSPIRSGIIAVALVAAGYAATWMDAVTAPDVSVLWFVSPFAAIFGIAALRALWLVLLGRPMAVFSAQGLRAHACDDVLIPWDLVASVTLITDNAPTAFSTPLSAALVAAVTSHDAYDVRLDPKVRELGVRHSDNLLSMGFKLTPLNLSLSSRAVAALFARHLPAERCIGFPTGAGPSVASEVLVRGAMAAVAVAGGTLERMEAEQRAAPPPDAPDGGS